MQFEFDDLSVPLAGSENGSGFGAFSGIATIANCPVSQDLYVLAFDLDPLRPKYKDERFLLLRLRQAPRSFEGMLFEKLEAALFKSCGRTIEERWWSRKPSVDPHAEHRHSIKERL